MNLTPVNVVIFGIGAILVYAAVKDMDPRDVVKSAFGQTVTKNPRENMSPNPYPNGQGPPDAPQHPLDQA